MKMDLKIYTTIDSKLQQYAEEAVATKNEDAAKAF
jgi:membrane peptidoglycan carboxypeptidase